MRNALEKTFLTPLRSSNYSPLLVLFSVQIKAVDDLQLDFNQTMFWKTRRTSYNQHHVYVMVRESILYVSRGY